MYLLNGIDANVSMSRNIRVEDFSEESDLRGIEWVGEGNLEVKVENTSLIRAAYRACTTRKERISEFFIFK